MVGSQTVHIWTDTRDSRGINCHPAEPDGDHEQDDGRCYQNELALAYWEIRSECPLQLGEDVG
jgi:hypothetical protein